MDYSREPNQPATAEYPEQYALEYDAAFWAWVDAQEARELAEEAQLELFGERK